MSNQPEDVRGLGFGLGGRRLPVVQPGPVIMKTVPGIEVDEETRTRRETWESTGRRVEILLG